MSAAISAFSRVSLAFCLAWLPACLNAQELPSGPWKRGAPMPTSRSEIAAAALDGRIYAVGGIAQWGTTALLEAYDPATDIWQELAPLPTAVHHMAAAAAGGRVLVTGGYADIRFSELSAQVWAYDPAAEAWSRVADMPARQGGPRNGGDRRQTVCCRWCGPRLGGALGV